MGLLGRGPAIDARGKAGGSRLIYEHRAAEMQVPPSPPAFITRPVGRPAWP